MNILSTIEKIINRFFDPFGIFSVRGKIIILIILLIALLICVIFLSFDKKHNNKKHNNYYNYYNKTQQILEAYNKADEQTKKAVELMLEPYFNK